MVKINSRNMRDKEYPYQKLAGVRRIVVVGDSFVFGWGVEVDETVTELLETKYLKGVEILNMGVSGYCANQEVERLKTEGVRFEPGLVLFFTLGYPSICPSEFQFDGDKMFWGSVHWPRNTLRERIRSFLGKNVYLYWLFERGYSLFTKLWIGESRLPRSHAASPSVIVNEGLKVLSDLRDVAGEKNFIPIVLYIPEKAELRDGIDSTTEHALKLLEDYCRKEKWGFLDLTVPLKQYWRSEKKLPYFRYDDHWNVDGHRAVAQAVANYLKNKNFLAPVHFKSDFGVASHYSNY